MSYIAFATDRFDAVADFYGETLGFPVVSAWDRVRGRGRRFDLGGGVRLEILDNRREPSPAALPAAGRVHVVVEVEDIQATWAAARLKMESAPAPARTSWGASVFQVHDPDGVPVTFLQWHADGQA